MLSDCAIKANSRGTKRKASAVMGQRELNRALLARQLLLSRSDLAAMEAIEHLVGLQAQTPNAPYLALWSRLSDFHPAQLTQLIQERRVVRIALMRGTIHSVTDRDCLELRPSMDFVLARALQGAFGKRLTGLNLKTVAAAGGKLMRNQGRSFNEIGVLLQKRWPDRDPMALANVVRALLPLVQVPPRGIWGLGGLATHVTAQAWLGRPLAAKPSLEKMIVRYLAAFGPASVRDMQSWSGLTRLGEVVERLRKDLLTFVDEQGHQLFDLPDAPRPDPQTTAPPRFLPVFDNILLGHADRGRILNESHRKMLFGSAALLEGSLLVDGFVAARWKIARGKDAATLAIEPFVPMRKPDRIALSEEGERFLKFVEPATKSKQIRFVKPSKD